MYNSTKHSKIFQRKLQNTTDSMEIVYTYFNQFSIDSYIILFLILQNIAGMGIVT